MKWLFLAVCFVTVIVSPVNAQSTLTLQEKCAEGAKKFIENHSSEGVVDYINHYNKKLDKCFIRIGYYFGKKDVEEWKKLLPSSRALSLPVWAVGIYDSFGGSQIASYFRDRGTTITCYVGNKQCKNTDEFEALTKPYMEE
jgi:hypothetical protein